MTLPDPQYQGRDLKVQGRVAEKQDFETHYFPLQYQIFKYVDDIARKATSQTAAYFSDKWVLRQVIFVLGFIMIGKPASAVYITIQNPGFEVPSVPRLPWEPALWAHWPACLPPHPAILGNSFSKAS